MKIHSSIILFFLLSVSNLSAQNIYRTACQGNLTRLDSMLNDFRVNTQDDRGRSLIHWAIACRQREVFDLLLDRGIDINLADNEGATPLHMAVRFNNQILMDTLIKLQPNMDWATKYGASLLELSILKKNLEVVKKLIANGVDVNIINDRGSIPIEIAMRTNAEGILEWLRYHGAHQELVRTFNLKGKYLGQKKPGLSPQVFAPNFISTEEYEFGSVLNKKTNEFYYGVDVNGKSEIRYSKRTKNLWSQPKTILSHERYGYNDPFLSPDENRLYFISERAMDGLGDLKDYDIWYVEREKDGWSAPINAGPNINSDGNEYYISFTKEGTMYFASNVNTPEGQGSNFDIYYSKSINGEFQEAVALGNAINSPAYEADVFVDPDETYLIFCATRSEGLGRGDLYISFKKADDQWTKAVNMGDKINTKHHELCPFVSHDGKYLFYTSNQDIYWVSTKIFKEFSKK